MDSNGVFTVAPIDKITGNQFVDRMNTYYGTLVDLRMKEIEALKERNRDILEEMSENKAEIVMLEDIISDLVDRIDDVQYVVIAIDRSEE